jgi:hypothetical protein
VRKFLFGLLFLLAGFFAVGLTRATIFLLLTIPINLNILQLYVFSVRELAIRGMESVVNVFHPSQPLVVPIHVD